MTDNVITKIEKLEPHPTEAIVISFNFDNTTIGEINFLYERIQREFPNNIIVAAPDYISLQSWSKDILENYMSMIAEVIEKL